MDAGPATLAPRPQTSGRAATKPSRLARSIGWIAALSTAPLAFIAAIWLMAARTPIPQVAALTQATISDATSLMAAVQSAGLRGTSDITGAIDKITRLDNHKVEIHGWAADAKSLGSSLAVLAFVDKAYPLTAISAAGLSTALAQLVGLSGPEARTAFEGTLTCTRDRNIVVVAVTSDRRYSQFRSIRCP